MPTLRWKVGSDGRPAKWTKKLRKFWEVYGGEAGMNATEAARIAGYGTPNQLGSRITQTFPVMVEEARVRLQASLSMGAREVDERLAAIARDPEHKDQFKALEALARIHGRFNDKLSMSIDRATLNKQIDELIGSMTLARVASTQSLHKSLAISEGSASLPTAN
jgi:hypothetical protein